MKHKHLLIGFLVSVVFAAALSWPAVAQPRGARGDVGPAERLERRLQFLDHRLDLSDEQVESVRTIMQNAHEGVAAWRAENTDASRKERHARMKEQRSATNAAIMEVLNQDQKEVFEDLKEERGQRGRGGKAARHLRSAFREMDLTDTQKDALAALRREHRATAKAWREAHPEASKDERREFRRTQRESMKQSLKSILTDEQLAKLREIRTEGRRGHRDSGPRNRASKFSLGNYPNPFNPSTEIRFELPESAVVSLAVFDLRGQLLSQPIDGSLEAGRHAIQFDGNGLPSGTYLYRLTVDGVTETGRMILQK